MEFLGAIVGKGEVKMDPIKVKAIEEWPVPTDLHSLRLFLGFGNYYKDFIEDYSKLTHPLHDLTKKGTPWHWGDSQRIAFINPEGEIHIVPSPEKSRPTQTLHTGYRCLLICSRCHAQPGFLQWAAPYSLFLQVIATSGAQLRHI